MSATSQDLKLAVHAETLPEANFYSFHGTLEIANVDQAKELVAPAFEQDPPKILFDLQEIDYIDSAGLGFLIGTLRRATKQGGSLKLCGLSAYMTGVFKIVNLQNILEVYESRDDALAAYKE